ncbi:hypothetical protein MSG28_002834 [Choristoneura fumiferana]|uniref:Uncharacterized protein n=1 Tax=Choristoneura fumiferana TaxID=7141 RepID=A0ACC0JJP8_CHOFU|nr:hypothetical protein MSG28_002834 [Choristoneura fumiferana]
MVIVGSLCAIIEATAAAHGATTLDIPVITEGLVYSIVLIYKLLILSCTQLNKPQYHCFLHILREDFRYVCSTSEGRKYRHRFFKNQLMTWKASLWVMIFTMLIAGGMIVFSIIALLQYLMTRTPGDGIMIQTQVVWVNHIATKADLVIWAIQDLLRDVESAMTDEARAHNANLIKYRMKAIVSQHLAMYTLLEAYAGVYKKLLMYEQKLCGPVVCLTAYCTAEKLDEGEFNAIPLLLGIATATLVFIPSYLCTFLAIKVKSICDACWDTAFWNVGPEIRPYFVLIMQRSLRPLPLQAPGFEEISIQTFSGIKAIPEKITN